MVHSILTHHPAEVADAMLHFLNALGGETKFCLAYGGTREEFDKILYPEKFFLESPNLRGSIEEQNFSCWLKATVEWARQKDLDPKVAHFTENDHIPLRGDYWVKLEEVLSRSGKDFLGKWCMDRTNTNEAFYHQYREDPVLLKLLEAISIHQNKTTIWGALADGMLFRWEALEALCRVELEIPCFTEILIPSSLHHLGFSPGDFDSYSKIFAWVRHRPEFLLSDVPFLLSQGAACCHPFKSIEDLPEIYRLVHEWPRVL
ncbi:MAG: hypothetical protein NTV93_21250 [Verrucomicrobia bacterium]|nr:hypothetical protein [Verrucomicrobiota bacterium]